MTQNYVVPNIYQDLSNQGQGYFAFRFTCQQCYWSVDTRPIRSTVSTTSNILDIGVGLLGGFWGRAAEAGQKIYGSQWHTEQAEALQRSWAEIQHEFHLCPKCHRTVCMRCFNVKLNLCNECAPDLRADGAHFQHQLNIESQREQIQEQYRAPKFNVQAIPSAATPEQILQPPQPLQLIQPGGNPSLAGYNVSASSQSIICPKCRQMGIAGKFCQDCGTRLPQSERHCPHCGSPLGQQARFCAECGTKLQSAT